MYVDDMTATEAQEFLLYGELDDWDRADVETHLARLLVAA